MKNDLLFSIVLPVYNRESFIEGCILSVLEQEWKDWELIVVDDGSTDRTAHVIRQFTDSRVHYLHIENSERGIARNTGIRLARGKYIGFLDSDDLLKPNYLSEAADIINRNPGIPIIHSGYEIRELNGKVIDKGDVLNEMINIDLISSNIICMNSILIMSGILEENKFHEERELTGSEDYELWLRLAARYPIRHFPGIRVSLIHHANRSMNLQQADSMIRRIIMLIQLVRSDKATWDWIGKRQTLFVSRRYSYISLHTALSGRKRTSIEYFIKAALTDPWFILTKRAMIIVFRIMLPGS